MTSTAVEAWRLVARAAFILLPLAACDREAASREVATRAAVAGDTLAIPAPDSLGQLSWPEQYRAAAAFAASEWVRRDRPGGVEVVVVRIEVPPPAGVSVPPGQATFNFTRAQLEGREPMVRTTGLQVETTHARTPARP